MPGLRRFFGALASVTLFASTLVTVTSAQAAAADAAPSDPLPIVNEAVDEVTAAVQARQTGKPVEIMKSRSENVRVFANPSGSLRAEISAVPQRIRRSDNTWAQVSTALQRTGGLLRPTATLAQLQLSGGGTTPLVTFAAGGGALSYRWEGSLPVPTIEGDTAVYTEVYPGVDLRVRALVDGFTYALIVKTPAAARNPALAKVKLGVVGSKLSVQAKPGGGFQAVNAKGDVAIDTGEALMWDSRGAAVIDVPRSERERAMMGSEQSRRELILNAKDVLAEPADTARRSSLEATYRDGAFTIESDMRLLNDPSAVFPLVIDPVSRTIPGAGAPKWGYTNTLNHNRNDSIARVGPDPDQTSNIFRSFFEFPVTSTVGGAATIIGASFQSWLIHSGDCTSRPVNLWEIGWFAPGRSNWSGPGLGNHLGEQWGNANETSCSQPDMYMEWTNNAVKSFVQRGLDEGWGGHSFGLLTRRSDGSSEGTYNWWKKFDPNQTKLWIEWSKKPTTPTADDLTTAAEPTAIDIACSAPSLVRGGTPVLRAKLRDPDNEEGGSLTGTFTWQKYVGASWQTQGTLTNTAPPATPSAPGNRAEVQLPQLADGGQYRWSVTTTDSSSLASDPSPWCEFTVAISAPSQKPVVTSTDYLSKETNPAAQGAVGQTGRFTFAANGVSNVASYTYWLEGGPARTVIPSQQGGSVSNVAVTPVNIGQNVLHVMSRDPAGNSSEELLYSFVVAGAAAPSSTWAMNDSGTVATASGVGARNATLNGNPVWTSGRYGGETAFDRALHFDGSGDYARTASGVFADHTRAVTMAAWVKLPTLPGAAATVAASDDGTNGALELAYLPGSGWCFTARFTNGAGQDSRSACAGYVAVNEWTHLMGVYDPSSPHQLKIFVNGVRGGHNIVANPVLASAAFTIGATRRNSAMTAFLTGTVSDVKVWNQAITPDQAQVAEQLVPKVAGSWNLDDNVSETALTAIDASGHGNTWSFSADPLDPMSATSWCQSFDFSGAVRFGQNESQGYASTVKPQVDTAGSFTFSAWVYIANRYQAKQTLVAQKGANTAAFALSFENDTWTFEVADSDTAGAAVTSASADDGGWDEWHHVAAVLRGPERTITVYVDGQAGATVSLRPAYQPWRAGGALIVGRGFAMENWLNADVDRVRLYAQALAPDQIMQDFNGAQPTLVSNNRPSLPTGNTVDGKSGSAVTTPDVTPDFAATVADPDGQPLWLEVALKSGSVDAQASALVKAPVGQHSLPWPDASQDWPASLTPGVTYQYRMRAFDGIAFGDWTAPVDVRVPVAGVVNNPPVPTTTVGPNSVRLTLKATPGDVGLVAGYRYGTDPRNLDNTVLTALDGEALVMLSPMAPTTVHVQALMADGTPNPNTADGKPRTTVVALPQLAGPFFTTRGDVHKDGYADSLGLMEVSPGSSAPYLMSAYSQYATAPTLANFGHTYPSSVTESAIGDFDGDGRADLAVLTENSGMKLKVLRYNGVGFSEIDTGYAPVAGMNADKTKLVVGDVNGDAKDDVIVVFEHGPNWWKTWVSLANGTSSVFAAPAMWYENPAGSANFRSSRWFMGDFNGDGKADFAHIYDHGSCQTKLWVYRSNGTLFEPGVVKWDSGINNWCWERATPLSGDLDGNGTWDFAMTYRDEFRCDSDYWTSPATANAGQPGGFSMPAPIRGWDSRLMGFATWCGEKMEPSLGDITKDGKEELRVLYHCCGTQQHMLFFTFISQGQPTIYTRPAWQGGFGPIGSPNVAISADYVAKYQMVSKQDGKCVGTPGGSQTDNVQMVTMPCTPAEAYTAFRIEYVFDAEIRRLEVSHSDHKCISVRPGVFDPGAPVEQIDCQVSQDSNTQWRIQYADGIHDPTVQLVVESSGKCLDVLADKLVQQTCGSGNSQKFHLRKVTTLPLSGPVAWWTMSDGGGTALTDWSGNGRTATLYGGATVAGGHASFNGTSAFAQTASSVVDTSKSFTVSSWVWLSTAGASANRTAVTQDGASTHAFKLGYQPANGGEWVVQRPSADSAASPPTAMVAAAATKDTWVRVAMVADVPGRQLRLYVDGQLVASTTTDYAWASTGNFTIGRLFAGTNVEFWKGDIDDVRVWNRALNDFEISWDLRERV